MANVDKQIIKKYYELVSLLQQQVTLAQFDRSDEQLDKIMCLEDQKKKCICSIDQIRESTMNYESISAESKEKISYFIHELQYINEQLQVLLNNWYGENSSSMKQITSQRRTLHAYGGVNQSDVISYFIDDKK